MLSNENDERKWAITVVGCIPPLVQILETGSLKEKEDSATVHGNLCSHSEDIRACVESADALSALLWLLKNESLTGKEIVAKTLNHLIHKSDTSTINQLTIMLTGDLPESKAHVLEAIKCLLYVAPLGEILLRRKKEVDCIRKDVDELNDSLSYALGVGGMFNVAEDSDYVHTFLAKAIHDYAALKAAESNEDVTQMDPRLESIVERILVKCILDGKVEKALEIALERKRLDKLEEAIMKNDNVSRILSYYISVSQTFVSKSEYRCEEKKNDLLEMYSRHLCK